MSKEKKKIAIFASGSGTNAEEIFKHFKNHKHGKVVMLFSNNPKAYAIERAKKFNIPFTIFDKHTFYETNDIIELVNNLEIDLIALAGFMWLIPENFLNNYPGLIINIHPALLPQYGGKGMYGSRVHEAVKNSGDKETGITIHHVNERYDDGSMIFQAKTEINPEDDSEDIENKVHKLEHKYYPKVIEDLIRK